MTAVTTAAVPTVHEVKERARQRRLAEEARKKDEARRREEVAAAEWHKALAFVHADYPCLRGHVDETPPQEWVDHPSCSQADFHVTLAGHARLDLVYERDGSRWVHQFDGVGRRFHVFDGRNYALLHDLGEALLAAEEVGKRQAEELRRAKAEDARKEEASREEPDALTRLGDALHDYILACTDRYAPAV